jgi:glucose/arabinose dehydrogenase
VEPATAVELQLLAGGFVAPVAMAVPEDSTGRIFIVDQPGQIYVIDAEGNRLEGPFLDLADRMVNVGRDEGEGPRFDERGLLGLAFHPDYAANGRFFVYYSAPQDDEDDPEDFDNEIHLSEFAVSDEDPNRADPDSEILLIEIDDPQFNHNGGQIAFGPDGFLYIGVGDGGNANDDGVGHNPDIGNGQCLVTLLGKILRIDIDSGDTYGIPADNPFADADSELPEIWVYGLRNPWRFSFDSMGRLFVADVGQDLFEEVNLITAGGGNYGWRIREGTNCFDKDMPGMPPEDCPEFGADGEELIDPIIEYPHMAEGQPFGISVTGGFFYEGDDIPGLEGDYVFGDWSTNFSGPDGTLFAARPDDAGAWQVRELAVEGRENNRLGSFILSFGRDANDELYILTSQDLIPAGDTGAVYRIVAAPPAEEN